MPSTRNRGRNSELLSAKLIEIGLIKRRDYSDVSGGRSTKNKTKKSSPCKKIKQENEDENIIGKNMQTKSFESYFKDFDLSHICLFMV